MLASASHRFFFFFIILVMISFNLVLTGTLGNFPRVPTSYEGSFSWKEMGLLENKNLGFSSRSWREGRLVCTERATNMVVFHFPISLSLTNETRWPSWWKRLPLLFTSSPPQPTTQPLWTNLHLVSLYLPLLIYPPSPTVLTYTDCPTLQRIQT